MTITFPRTDIMDAIGVVDTSFRLVHRQEASRTAAGRTIVKDLGGPLWRAEMTTRPYRHSEAARIEAMFQSLDGAIGTFEAWDLRKCFTVHDPSGSLNTGAVAIAALGVDGRSLSLDGLPAGYVMTPGDYLSFDYGAGPSRALHRIMEDAAADAAGLTPVFEVRPHIRPGASVNAAVRLEKPAAIMALEPDSFEASMSSVATTVIRFSALQVL
jgi:hypothetical protein